MVSEVTNKLAHWILFLLFVLLTIISGRLVLSSLHDRAALTAFYGVREAETPVSKGAELDSSIAAQSAMALSLNPLDANHWLHSATYTRGENCPTNSSLCRKRLSFLTKAIALRPNFARAWAFMVSAHLNEGRTDEAELALRRAQMFAPFEYYTLYATIELVLTRTGKPRYVTKLRAADAFQILFSQTQERFVTDFTRHNSLEQLSDLALSAGMDAAFMAVYERQLKAFSRNPTK